MKTSMRHALVVPAVAVVLCGCSADWPAFRHDFLRTARQRWASPLSNPSKAKTLHVVWRFPAEHTADLDDGFRASPVVYKGRVFIGNGNGYFYALNARTGQQIWQYPPAGSPPLTTSFPCVNPSSHGIASSAAIARIGGVDAVIFAAPGPLSKTNKGNGRLFALNTLTGKKIWMSPVIARLTGNTPDSQTEFHENLGHSSPLVLGNKVYVGVSDHCDSPIQKGRVVAVNLANGKITSRFKYCSAGDPKDCSAQEPRGGGVWSSPAGLRDGVYITTGNTNTHDGTSEPKKNYGLSLLRLNASTGDISWTFQPVPWEMDSDPDWSAAPTIMAADCGLTIISTQKDGWTHAINAADGKRQWSFPPHKIPFVPDVPGMPGDGTAHGDDGYMRSGAVWGNVYVAMNGGLNLTTSGVTGGYHRLHAFNVCEPESNRLRWLIDVPGTSPDCSRGRYCLGNPTVTGGIVYVGTDRGHLVAIADPTVAPAAGWRCENPSVKSMDCAAKGYRLTRQPAILADVSLPVSLSGLACASSCVPPCDTSCSFANSLVYAEPVLANGKVYISTEVRDCCGDGKSVAGYVYMLQP